MKDLAHILNDTSSFNLKNFNVLNNMLKVKNIGELLLNAKQSLFFTPNDNGKYLFFLSNFYYEKFHCHIFDLDYIYVPYTTNIMTETFEKSCDGQESSYAITYKLKNESLNNILEIFDEFLIYSDKYYNQLRSFNLSQIYFERCREINLSIFSDEWTY